MHRHLIAGALACFGSSLFGQTTTNPAQGTLNNIQNTLQNGVQKAQDTVDTNVQQRSGSSVQGDVQNRSSLNAQSQVNGASGPTGIVGNQSNTNLQSNSNLQPGQLNSNLSTQVQGQSGLGTQQRGSGVPQDQYNQYGNTIQTNGSNGSQSFQRQGQQMQSGQSQTQGWNAGANPNSGSMQYRPQSGTGNSMSVNNMQQPGPSQNGDRVYVLRVDGNGREFICVDGRQVYFDNVNSVSVQRTSGTQNQYSAGYGNYDLKNGQNSQNNFRNADRPQNEQQTPGSGQRSTDAFNAPGGTYRDRSNSDEQNESRTRQNDGSTQSNSINKSDAINPSKTLNDSLEPKS